MRRGNRPGPHDNLLFICVCVLTALGLVMVYSASYAYASRQGLSPDTALLRQAVAVGVGLAALVCLSFVPLAALRRAAGVAYLGSVALLVLVLFIGLGPEEGVHRWLVGPFGLMIQPSVIGVVALVLCIAGLGERYAGQADHYEPFMLLSFGAIGITCVLTALEPSLSMACLACVSGLAVLLVAGARIRHMAAVVGIAFTSGLMYALSTGYMRQRITEYIDATSGGEHSYQVSHCLTALGSGGLLGKGLCQGVEKYGYLPEVHNDMIFAAIGEEMGLVMTLAVVVLYVLFVVRGCRIALRADSLYTRFTAAGLTAMIATQAAVNMLVVVGAVPATGVPLPFISAGGSSVAVLLGAAGLLISASRECPPVAEEVTVRRASRHNERRDGRARLPGPGRSGLATRYR